MKVKNKIIASAGSCYDAHISCADDCLGSIQNKGTVKGVYHKRKASE